MSLVKRNLVIKITNTQHLLAQRNTRTRRQSCPKSSKKTPARRQWRRSSVFIANPEHIPHLAPVSPSPIPNMQLPARYLQLELIL